MFGRRWLLNDYVGSASRELRRRMARTGQSGVVVGVRYLPWRVRWLVDRIYVEHWPSCRICLDDVPIGEISRRQWRPAFKSVPPGLHIVAVEHGTGDLLASANIEVGSNEVVSVVFTQGRQVPAVGARCRS
jgi:hypothetical protein